MVQQKAGNLREDQIGSPGLGNHFADAPAPAGETSIIKVTRDLQSRGNRNYAVDPRGHKTINTKDTSHITLNHATRASPELPVQVTIQLETSFTDRIKSPDSVQELLREPQTSQHPQSLREADAVEALRPIVLLTGHRSRPATGSSQVTRQPPQRNRGTSPRKPAHQLGGEDTEHVSPKLAVPNRRIQHMEHRKNCDRPQG